MSARLAMTLRLGLAATLATAVGALSPAPAWASPQALISPASEGILEAMLGADNAGASTDPATRAASISGQFLGTPYGAHTLVGSATEPEELVVELARVDCFTYADYVEALKRSDNRDEFIDSLIGVRYKNGDVSFENRKHFFTDWAASTPAVATDITASLSDDAIAVPKNLNSKDSGGVYLPGLPVVPRTVIFIPSEKVDADVISGLRTGDYIGAYAEDGGLDVTHVGIFIDSPDGPVFRNASSLSADSMVVDTPLGEYLQTVPGIVVLRPLV